MQMTTPVEYAGFGRGERADGVLIDRHEQLGAIAAMVDEVRQGLSGALVLRGDGGTGKSAVLEHAIDSVPDFHVACAAGVPSEMELAFAGVHQLVRRYLSGVKRLPAPQRDALASALGLRSEERRVGKECRSRWSPY